MISIEEARDILWKDGLSMTDDQVRDLLNLLYSTCNIVYKNLIK